MIIARADGKTILQYAGSEETEHVVRLGRYMSFKSQSVVTVMELWEIGEVNNQDWFLMPLYFMLL